MKKIVGLWVGLLILVAPAFSQVDTSYIYNTAMPYGTLDLRVAKSATRYYYLQENVTFSFRESAPGVKTNTFRDMTSWNSDPYTQGNLREKNGNLDQFVMNYRLLFPKNYNAAYDPGYPIIIMLHGYGERGNCWNDNCYWSTTGWNPNTNSPAAPTSETHNLLNNDHNLLHGGLKHLDAVNLAGTRLPNDPSMPDKAFPGFVLFPQAMNGWQHTQRVEDAIKLLRLIIKKYNIDENRVYIHALSNGGGGLYQAIKRAPWLFAAALPMSAVSNGGIFTDGLAQEVGKIPMWVFQGGKDRNPTPSRTYNTVKGLREAGASVRYYLYPHLGHGTWNSAYNEPDFFPWILQKRKYNPHVYYGNPVICNTTGAGVRISFSNGFHAYQWEHDGAVLTGATASQLVANTPGTYRGRFSRIPNPTEADWEPWSDPIVVTEISPAKPSITALGSTHLRGPGLVSNSANNTVQLKSDQQAELYLWYKNGTQIDFPGTDVNDTLRVAGFTSAGSGANGTYTLKTSFSYCPSPASDPVYLFFNNSAPQNMVFNAATADFKGLIMNGGVFLSWNDLVSAESGYEIWRRKSGEAEFKFAGKTAKNAISFFDGPLQPNATYEYKIRAVGNTGVSNYVPSNDLATNLVINTPADNVKPMPPQNLKVTINTIDSFTLSWEAPSDNTGIKSYVITYGSQVVDTGTATNSFTITGLPANTVYPVSVKAIDHAGNVSEASNQIIAGTYVLGLFYKHSTGGWEDLDDTTLVETWVNPEFTGTVSNFTLAPRTQEDFFNFQYTGYLDVLTEGPYIFRLTSNDGSRLLIDNALAIENDGVHGNVTKFSDTLMLSKGPHHLELQYFDYAGSQTLTLQYKGPDLNTTYKPIPDSLLRSGKFIPAAAPPIPFNVVATGSGMQRVDVSWTPNGNNVEVYRGVSATGPFKILGANATGIFTDTIGLTPGTNYFYVTRTLATASASGFTTAVTATTLVDNVPPTIPSNLTLQNKSHTSAALTWSPSSDNATVKLYEVYVNGVLKGTSTLPAFMITDLDPGGGYAITVKAVDESNNRSEASAVLALTTNPAATYYSMASGNLNALSTWRQNANGTGSSPVDFTENGLVFIIANRASTGLGGDWDVSGAASKVIVPAGVTLTVDFLLTGKIELQGNSTLNINHAVVPLLCSVSPSSTVNFIAPSTIPLNTYGNLIVSGTGIKSLEPGTTNVQGNITVETGAVLKGAAGNASQLLIAGNLDQRNINNFVASDNRISVNFSENIAHVVSTQSDILFYEVQAGANSAVSINASTGPVSVITGSLNGGGIVLSGGSLLNVNTNSLEVIGAGAINPSNETGVVQIASGDLKISSTSTASSNLYFSATNHEVDSMVVDVTGGKVIIRTPLSVSGAIKISGGELAGNGLVTLKANEQQTAVLSAIGEGGMYSGNLNVEHFIPYIQDQRVELAAPVSGVTVANWQIYFPVTGAFAGASAGSSEASLFTYNGSSLSAYPAAGGSNSAPIERGKGYQAKITNTSALTVTTTGVPNQGSINIPLIPNATGGIDAGWNLVGNPYPAALEWSDSTDSFTRSGIANTIAVRENKIIDGTPIGQYQYYSTDLGNSQIPSGKAFWVRTLNAAPSLTIHEKAKAETGISTPGETSHLMVTLKQNNKADHTYILFSDNATDGIDQQFDFPKRMNDGVFNLSSVVNGSSLAVNALSKSFCTTTATLAMTAVSEGNYVLTFSGLGSLTGIGNVSLKDNFTNTTQSLSADYAFSITSDAASSAAGRFVITFARTQLDLAGPSVTGLPLCSNASASIVIDNSQPGVLYTPVNTVQATIGQSVEGNGETIELEVAADQLQSGSNNIAIQAGFAGCAAALLNTQATIEYLEGFTVDVQDDISICLGTPAQIVATGVPAGGSYRWYDEAGNVVPMQTSGTLTTPPIENEISYQVAGILANGCESEKVTVHIYADTLKIPEIVMFRDTLFTQVDAAFQWYRNGNRIEGASSSYFVPTVTGDYTVEAFSSGCSKVSLPYKHVIDPGCILDTSVSFVSLKNNECAPEAYEIEITFTQQDVQYSIINVNDELISESLAGTGDVLVLALASSSLDSGLNRVRIRTELAGCINRTLDKELDINNIAPVDLNIEDQIKVCSGTSATITVTAGADVTTMQWFDSAGNLIDGQNGILYTTPPVMDATKFFVSAEHTSGCWTPRKQIDVIPVIVTQPLIYFDEDALSVNSTLPVQWYLAGQPIPDATTSSYSPTKAGSYTAIVSDGSCSSESAPYVYLMTGVEESASEFAVQVYPNPGVASKIGIMVQSPFTDKILVRVISMTGQTLFEGEFTPGELSNRSYLFSKLSNGMYTFIATQGQNEIRRRVVIQN